MLSAIIAATLLIIGALFCLIAAVGMLRLPDTLIRMHAATKAGTLGTGFILAAEAVTADDLGTTIRAVAVIVFVLLTAPVGAHLIGRAAYHRGVQLFDKTWIDELGETMKNTEGEPVDRHREPTEASSGPVQHTTNSRRHLR